MSGQGSVNSRSRRRAASTPPVEKAPASDDGAAARAILERVIQRLSPDEVPPVGPGLVEAAERLEALVVARTEEIAEKSAAVEAANHELRSLTRNLDSIVRQRTRALAESESQLRRKNVELDRLNRMKGEFISIAAHELRTPLTSIVGYLDLFSEKLPPGLAADSRRQLEALRRNTYRLRRLIDDMLDVSRLEAGSVTLRRRPCSLGEIVLAALEDLRPLAEERMSRVSTQIAEIPAIDADPDRIHQVVSNLLANGLKYLGSDGEVRLIVDRGIDEASGDRYACLRVWDNGKGIPEAQRARVFEPFSDVNTAKHHTSAGPDSAGLGLRIARGLVELHGGHLRMDSQEGRFTEFTALLPFA